MLIPMSEAQPRFCYILTEECLERQTGCEIRLHCIDDSGPLLLRFTRQEPLFFLREADMPRGENLLQSQNIRTRRVELTDFRGEGLYAVYCRGIRQLTNLRNSLRQTGIRPQESDIRPEERFLMERFIHRSLEYRGGSAEKQPYRIITDPEIRSTEYRPVLSILSLDIETSPDSGILCVGLHYTASNGSESGEVHILNEYKKVEDGDGFNAVCYSSERAMIEGAAAAVRRFDPDLLTGWNVIGFDLEMLNHACERLGIRFGIGRDGTPPRCFQKQSGMRSAELRGRIVLDGPQAMRGGFHSFPDFSLETVANTVLGTGKTISADEDKVAEIMRLFAEDPQALAIYNFEDCRLVSRILTATGLIEQYMTRSLLTGLRLDRVSMSVAAFEFQYLPKMHRQGFAAPDTEDIFASEQAAGGYVFTTEPGRYSHVIVLDFRSLYPSIIRTFSIDPLSLLTAAENPGNTPAGISFNRERSILPGVIGELLARRAEAKRAGDAALSQAVKILMNSFYGVMGTPGCRFYDPRLPTAITGTGQWVLKISTARLRESGYQVLYGDTDSVFVQLKPDEIPRANEAAEKIVSWINQYLKKLLTTEYGVQSFLELEYEKHYDVFFLPPMRGSSEGARKRYAGRLAETGEIEFRGMEYVRSDWTDLAKEFQFELFRRFFSGEEIPRWILSEVEAVSSGYRDEKLIYRRRLTKRAEGYVKNVPPHVKAARMLDPEGKLNIRRVDYFITPEGPVPVKLCTGPIDYKHYIEKQIKPVADGVLPWLNTSFDEIVSGKQLELF